MNPQRPYVPFGGANNSATASSTSARRCRAEHAKFTVATDVPVYFCDPHSPWQRDSNENANGLLRQYFPCSTDFKAVTQSDLDLVAAELNGRPRQTLGWKTPCQALDEALSRSPENKLDMCGRYGSLRYKPRFDLRYCRQRGICADTSVRLKHSDGQR